MKESIIQRVEATLNSLDGLQRAEANFFIAGKIKRRLKDETIENLPQQWIWRLAAVMTAVVILNVTTLSIVVENKTRTVDAITVATEYSISLPETY
jgi:hypothetical protein